jgi:hypothetical protein
MLSARHFAGTPVDAGNLLGVARVVKERADGPVLRLPLLCRFLGRLHDDPIHARRREASEKRQCTKSRLVGRQRRSGLDDALIGMPTLMMSDGAIGHRTQPLVFRA